MNIPMAFSALKLLLNGGTSYIINAPAIVGLACAAPKQYIKSRNRYLCHKLAPLIQVMLRRVQRPWMFTLSMYTSRCKNSAKLPLAHADYDNEPAEKTKAETSLKCRARLTKQIRLPFSMFFNHNCVLDLLKHYRKRINCEPSSCRTISHFIWRLT